MTSSTATAFTRRTLLRLALLLGFALGQCAALLHYSQHEIAGGDNDSACQICGVANDLGGAPALATLPLPLLPDAEAPAILAPRAPQTRHRPRPHSTGPPALA